jgi:tetratricopeptide (TPR) repeat protein
MRDGVRGSNVICFLWSGMAFLMLFQLPVAHAQSASSSGETFDSLLRRGSELNQRGDFQDALPLLGKAWQLRPHDYSANLLLGIDLVRTGKSEAAIGFLKEAARLNPNEEPAYTYRGEAEADLGHNAEASAAYLRALAIAPTSQPAIEAWVDYSLGRLNHIASQLHTSDQGLAAQYRINALSCSVADTECRKFLLRAAALDPGAPGIWSEIAFADFAGGDLAEARKNVDLAVRQNPEDLRAKEVEALLAATRGDWTAAVAALNTIGARSPGVLAQYLADWPASLQPVDRAAVTGPSAAYLDCARRKNCSVGELRSRLPVAQEGVISPDALMSQQRWEAIVSLPAPAPNDEQAWFRRGAAFAHLGDCMHAIPALENVRGKDADAVPRGFLLSSCYAMEGVEALGQIERAGGDPALLQMLRGEILLLHADAVGAVSAYSAALAIHANDAHILERLAEAQRQTGDLAAAEKTALRALQIDPYRFSAMKTFAFATIVERKYDEALPYLKQLAIHNPNDLAVQAKLGTVYAATGNQAEALRNLAEALNNGYPDERGSLHYLLGTAQRSMGRKEEAAQSFAKARQLSDDFQNSVHQDQNEQ